MSRCSQCGCALPGFEHLCQTCFAEKYNRTEQTQEIPVSVGRRIGVFLSVFSVLFLGGLLEIRFLGYHMTPKFCALTALLFASLAAYFENGRDSLTHRRRS
jgi:hypothetical protein